MFDAGEQFNTVLNEQAAESSLSFDITKHDQHWDMSIEFEQ